MQAIILAAGKSTRAYPLTLTRPKPLLPIAGKPLLAHTLHALRGIITEAVLIVGYRQEMIRDAFGGSFEGIKLTYIEQKEQRGTAHALLCAKDAIKEKFLLLAGDDLYAHDDLQKLAAHRYALLIASSKNPERYGVVETDSKGLLRGIEEKPKEPKTNLISTSCVVLDRNIFECISQLKKSSRDEYELPEALLMLSKKHPMQCIMASSYYSVGYPKDLWSADMAMRQGNNVIAATAQIRGEVKNSSIGERCVIRGDVINSLLFDGVVVKEGSLVVNSVLGEGISFDGKILLNDGSLEFGAVIGDGASLKDAHVSASASIWPHMSVSGAIEGERR